MNVCLFCPFLTYNMTAKLDIYKMSEPSKRLLVEQNGPKFGLQENHLVHTEYFWPLHVQGHSNITSSKKTYKLLLDPNPRQVHRMTSK